MAAAVALGIEVVRDEPGHGTCRLTIAGEHLNQGLVTHGGVLFTLADTALGVAANPPGEPTWVGTQFSLQMFRAVAVGDSVVAEAREEHRSRRLMSYAVRLEREADGALVGTMDAQLLAAREGGRARRLGALTLAPEPAGSPLARALLAAAGREAAPRRRASCSWPPRTAGRAGSRCAATARWPTSGSTRRRAAGAWPARYTGPSRADGTAVTPTRPGPVCVPITGPISDTTSGSRP